MSPWNWRTIQSEGRKKKEDLSLMEFTHAEKTLEKSGGPLRRRKKKERRGAQDGKKT